MAARQIDVSWHRAHIFSKQVIVCLPYAQCDFDAEAQQRASAVFAAGLVAGPSPAEACVEVFCRCAGFTLVQSQIRTPPWQHGKHLQQNTCCPSCQHTLMW